MSNVPYASTIGSLMYAMVCTSSDISHAVGFVSKYMSHLGIEHWNAVKWITLEDLLLIYRAMLTQI